MIRQLELAGTAAPMRTLLAFTAALAFSAASCAASTPANQKANDHDADDKVNAGDQRFTVRPDAVAFGRQPLFVRRTESFYVRNTGKSALHVQDVDLNGYNEKVFAVTNECRGAVPPGQECRVNVTFEPTSDGDKSVDVRIVTADHAMRTRRVTGTGVKAQYTAVPRSLAFGRVARNTTSRPQTITITNTGNVWLPITSTALSGPNEHQFAQSNDCPTELAVGRTCMCTVLFKPTFDGNHTATLTVWAKGAAPETMIALTGSGH